MIAFVQAFAKSSSPNRHFIMLRRALCLFLAASVGLNAQAATYACSGRLDNVTVDPNGNVNATFVFDNGGMAWQDICSISQTTNNVNPISCKGILSLLLAAKAGNQRIMMWFDNSTGSSCSAPAWRPLREMGWYWGPALIGN